MAMLKGNAAGDYIDVNRKARFNYPLGVKNPAGTGFGTIWVSAAGAWRFLGSGYPVDLEADGTAFGAVSGAAANLGNLAAVAINADLDPAANNARDLGDATHRFQSLYLGTSVIFQGTNRKLTVTASEPAAADRAINFPDPGGSDSVVYTDLGQTLVGKALTSPIVTGLRIADSGADHEYIVIASDLAANRNITLPLLAGADTFVFADFIQTLTNKTISGAANTITNIALANILNAGGAQGDVLYWSGAAWTKLAAGTNGYYLKTQGAAANPVWDLPSAGVASQLAQTVTAEAGANDYTLHFNGPAAARHLDINDPLADDVFVFASMAQTLAAKTLTAPKFADLGFIADPSANEMLLFNSVLNAVDYIAITNAATANPATVSIAPAGDDANINLSVEGKGTGVFTVNGASFAILPGNTVAISATNPAASRVYTIPDAGADSSFVMLAGAQAITGAKTMTAPILITPWILDSGATEYYKFVVSNLAADRNITLPLLAGDDTFVFLAHAGTLTNKTINAPDNTVTNITGLNVDSIAATTGTHTIPFILVGVNAGVASLKITDSAPVKFRVIDAWAINTQINNAGNWKLQDNASADITTAVAYGAVDNALTRVSSIADATHTISAGQDLYLINSNAADTSIVYVSCLPVD